MRIVFVGAVEFSLRLLEKLLDMQVMPIGVVSAKDRNRYSDFADLGPLAREFGIPHLSVDDLNSEVATAWMASLEPDFIFCFGWSQILRRQVLDIPRRGVMGYHPTKLPQNRGRHPIIWTIALGLTETASTFFMMDEGVDSGPIVSQQLVAVSDSEDAASLYRKLVGVARRQLEATLPKLFDANLVLLPQANTSASHWRKRSKEDGKIDWRMSSLAIERLVRALSKPYSGATFEIRGTTFVVWECRRELVVPVEAEPGKVLAITASSVLVKAGSGGIWLEKLEPFLSVQEGEYL